MTKARLTDSEQVTRYIAALPTEIQPAVEYLRQVMLSIDQDIAEHIKWNSPAFYFSGEMSAFDSKEYKRDLLVLNLRKDKIMCVLPTGMRIRNNIELLGGDYTDGRRMIYFKDVADIKLKEQKLRNTIKEWLALVKK